MEQTSIKIKSGLALLREPFPDNQISQLPKGTKAQNDCAPNEKVNCNVCGGWHHPKIVHLSYVGHAALTNRLLECDPEWNWQPLSLDANGLPAIDANGGMWIKLTVCGITRLGYGDASGKTGGNAIKEIIGDALRNSAMRFGAALDLWSKVDLHPEEPDYPISLEQSSLIADELLANDVKPEVFCAKANIRSVSELPSSKFEDAFKWIAIRAAQQKERAANPKQHNQPNKPPGSLLE
jgi:hypothetical protein